MGAHRHRYATVHREIRHGVTVYELRQCVAVQPGGNRCTSNTHTGDADAWMDPMVPVEGAVRYGYAENRSWWRQALDLCAGHWQHDMVKVAESYLDGGPHHVLWECTRCPVKRPVTFNVTAGHPTGARLAPHPPPELA